MGAFIAAIVIALVTLAICALMFFGSMMSDSPSASEQMGRSIIGTFFTGMVMAALIAASHFLPHIGW